MKYFLLYLLFLSSTTLASELVLDRTNHFGIRKIDRLKFEKNNYYFGGKNMGSQLPASVQESWKEFAKGPVASSRKPACASGTFRFSKKSKGKTAHIRGCSEGADYGRLVRHLENIRQHAKGL